MWQELYEFVDESAAASAAGAAATAARVAHDDSDDDDDVPLSTIQRKLVHNAQAAAAAAAAAAAPACAARMPATAAAAGASHLAAAIQGSVGARAAAATIKPTPAVRTEAAVKGGVPTKAAAAKLSAKQPSRPTGQAGGSGSSRKPQGSDAGGLAKPPADLTLTPPPAVAGDTELRTQLAKGVEMLLELEDSVPIEQVTRSFSVNLPKWRRQLKGSTTLAEVAVRAKDLRLNMLNEWPKGNALFRPDWDTQGVSFKQWHSASRGVQSFDQLRQLILDLAASRRELLIVTEPVTANFGLLVAPKSRPAIKSPTPHPAGSSSAAPPAPGGEMVEASSPSPPRRGPVGVPSPSRLMRVASAAKSSVSDEEQIAQRKRKLDLLVVQQQRQRQQQREWEKEQNQQLRLKRKLLMRPDEVAPAPAGDEVQEPPPPPQQQQQEQQQPPPERKRLIKGAVAQVKGAVTQVAAKVSVEHPEHPPPWDSLEHAQAMVGKRLQLYWGGDRRWFKGTIAKFNPHTWAVFIRYDDGDVKWHHMYEEMYELLEPKPNKAAEEPKPKPKPKPSRPAAAGSSAAGQPRRAVPASASSLAKAGGGGKAARQLPSQKPLRPTPSGHTAAPRPSAGATAKQARGSVGTAGGETLQLRREESDIAEAGNTKTRPVGQETNPPFYLATKAHECSCDQQEADETVCGDPRCARYKYYDAMKHFVAIRGQKK